MRLLCERNGTELILVKAPTNIWGFWWYDEWDKQIKTYAAEKGLAYYNFIGNPELTGIDFSTDTYDGGMHLNVYGAEKMTDCFGKILAENHSLPDKRDDTETAGKWESKIARYYAEKARMESENQN